jgi:short-subunit dehydrogenase
MNKRIVLVTGASSGIGREIARQLAQNKDFPILVGRNKQSLETLKNELKDAECFTCDVTSEEQVKQLVEQVIYRFGKIDVLVNNAGFGVFGPFLEVPIETHKQIIDTNYLGAVRLTYEVIPYMLQQGSGRIINIASIAGLIGVPNLAAYSASKFALIGFSEAIHLEYSPVIQVGVLCPGPVRTPFFGGKDPFELFPRMIARQLLDSQTVARYAVKLIDHPQFLVIPPAMRWAIQVGKIFPKFHNWSIKKMYSPLIHKESPQQPTM